MSELKKAMKENIPVIKRKNTPVKKRYEGPQPNTDYSELVDRHSEIYKKAFKGNSNWDNYFKGK